MHTTTFFLPAHALSTHRALQATWSAALAELPAVHALAVVPDAVLVVHRVPLGGDPTWLCKTPLGHQRRLVRGDDDLVRAVHDVHVAPCRRGLVDDPLAWAWSTHRDHLGLALPAVVTPRRPWRPRVHPGRQPAPAAIVDAVSAITRTWREDIGRVAYPRSLAHAALASQGRSVGFVNALLGATGPRLWVRPADLALLWWVAGDDRFTGLHPDTPCAIAYSGMARASGASVPQLTVADHTSSPDGAKACTDPSLAQVSSKPPSSSS